MLHILSVCPAGFFSFGHHGTIWLDNQGSVLLDGINKDRSGGANGAGKSALFNTISHILYDRNPSGCTGESIVNILYGKYLGKVEFLDNNSTKWRVIYTRKWKKQDKYPCDELATEPSQWHNLGYRYTGTELYLERWDDSLAIWVDERATNVAGEARLEMKATRKKLIGIIGVEYEQFLSIAYLAQQQSLKFVTGTHKDKLQILSDLCDLSVWDNRLLKTKEKIQSIELEICTLKSSIDGAKNVGSIIQLPDEYERLVLTDRLAKLALDIKACDDRLSKVQTLREEWLISQDNLNNKRNSILYDIKQLHILKEINQKLIAEQVKIYADRCNEIRSRPRDTIIDTSENERSVLRGNMQMRRMDMEMLLTGQGKCPRCRSFVTTEHLLRQRELLTVEISELDAKINNFNKIIEDAIKTWEANIYSNLDMAEQQLKASRNNIDAQIFNIDSSIMLSTNDFTNLQLLQSQLGHDPQQQFTEASYERMRLISEQSNLETKLIEIDKYQEKWRLYQKSISDMNTKLVSLQFRLQHLKVVERYFGDHGIKAHKLTNILSMLNNLIQKYINILSDNSIQMWITPFREKSSGDMTTDIQIMVREGNKEGIPFALYSGGERQQMVLALIGALWHLANSQGSGCNLMLLDEVLGSLDETNTSRVFEFLTYLRSIGKNSIFCITHDAQIKSQMDWDQYWTVTKSGHQSVLQVN